MVVDAEMVKGSPPLRFIDDGIGTSFGANDATGDGAVLGAVDLHAPTSAMLQSASVCSRLFIQ
jgi:hypothetical protein